MGLLLGLLGSLLEFSDFCQGNLAPEGCNLGTVPNRGNREVVGLGGRAHLSHHPEYFIPKGIYLMPG